MVFRFVIGRSSSAAAEAELAAEEQLHGDFLRLPLVEAYNGLPNKTRTFFNAVGRAYQAGWVVKLDDDVYLMPQRLPLVAQQWGRMGAGYVGCMKHGDVWKKPGTRWYEPRNLLIGKAYYLHAYGSIYVLSGDVVERVVVRNFDNLRLLANEDTTVGVWMLSHAVTHFEDMRLCVPGCNQAAVGVLSNWCAGLCDPVADMYRMHGNESCQMAVKAPLPYIRSYPEHREFESMWVSDLGGCGLGAS
jgi:hypothetical protein